MTSYSHVITTSHKFFYPTKSDEEVLQCIVFSIIVYYILNAIPDTEDAAESKADDKTK